MKEEVAMMTDKMGELNKWRMDQFHKNNKSDGASDTDFVCLSPTKLGSDSDDPNTVFLSDSDQDISIAVVAKEPQILREIKKTRGERKRKKIVYAHVSESDDSDVVVERSKRKRATKKLNIPKTRKMAVVAPITKLSLSADALAETVSIKDDVVVGGSKKKTVVHGAKGDFADDLKKDAVSNAAKGDIGSDIIENGKPDKPVSECLSTTPNKHSGDLGLLDDLLNSPVIRKSQKLKDGQDKPSNTVESQIPSATDQSKKLRTQMVNTEASSESDISLFEVSINHDTLPRGFGNQGPNQVLRNPPPSPIHEESGGLSRDINNSSSINMQAFTPMDNGFSSDSSSGNVTKKRPNKGKQPANKRKKVMAKRSKPLEIAPEPSPIKSSESTPSRDDNTKTEKRILTVVSPALSISLLEDDVLDDSLKEKDHGEPSVSSASQTVNKAIVKPNPVVLIDDDEDDDEVVMLTNNERDKQEMDDLEFARRLQAQFDGENTAPVRNAAAATPSRGAGNVSPVTVTDSPLPRSSQRLLEALGCSPAISQYLGSSRLTRRHAEAAPAELANVEQRLELLQQLALQQEYLDDTTISEILGMPAAPPPSTTPLSTTDRTGPRPPATQQRGRIRRPLPLSHTAAGSSRGGDGRRTGGGLSGRHGFQRVMQGFLGMDDLEDMGYEALLELSERIGDVRQPGMSPEAIDRLPAREYKQGEIGKEGDNACHICMSDFEAGQKLRTLTCFHDYHSQCIDQWLQRNATCPICRVKVSLE